MSGEVTDSELSRDDTAMTSAGEDAGFGPKEGFRPVLQGTAQSDYENYMRTDELLSLQRDSTVWVHRDELLFQITHQSSELWLKLAAEEVREASRLLSDGDMVAAVGLLGRASLALRFITAHLDMLERLTLWRFQEIRKKALGHGSGFDSPGWRALRQSFPELESHLDRLLSGTGVSARDVYREPMRHPTLHQLMEAAIDVDESAQLWRLRHFQVLSRVIGDGDGVVGTQGTPVEKVRRLIQQRAFPGLWAARNELTALADATYA
jgi:tryptophan 2,3-dioxygenase